MNRLLDGSARTSATGALFALLMTSCVCPPCPEAGGVAPEPTGPLVIWDGDGGGLSGGKQWADCDKKPQCKASVAVKPGVGRDGSTGLVFHAEGPAWNGFGWNWFGWWPEDAGSDISSYDQFSFWIKVEAESPDKAPPADAVGVGLRCSKGKKDSKSAQISLFQKNFDDGDWHQVVVPVAEFLKGKEGKEFDPQTVWEFGMNSWAPSPRNFTIYIDDVKFENSTEK